MEVVSLSALKKGDRPIAKLGEDYVVLRESGAQALEAPDGKSFLVLPEVRERTASHIHCAGPSGCGKSTWANEFARLHREELGGKVLVVSADPEPDPALSEVDARIGIDPTLASLSMDELREVVDGAPLLIVFDDVEGIDEPRTRALRAFVQAVKERGRKFGISSLSIYHRGAANKATAASLGEATGFLVFPGSVNNNTRYMLQQYAGLPPEFLSTLRRAGWGRWVFIFNGSPPFAIGEKKAALLDSSVLEAFARAERSRLRKEVHAIVIAPRFAQAEHS